MNTVWIRRHGPSMGIGHNTGSNSLRRNGTGGVYLGSLGKDVDSEESSVDEKRGKYARPTRQMPAELVSFAEWALHRDWKIR